MKPLSAYHPRPIRYHGLVEQDGWKLKIYRITKSADIELSDQFIKEATDVALKHLESPKESVIAAGVNWSELPHYHVGYLIIHIGNDAAFALLDYWVGENMLNHQTWAKPVEDLTQPFVNISSSGINVCVWEMAVQIHERKAWLEHVYRADERPDINAYLNDTFNADV